MTRLYSPRTTRYSPALMEVKFYHLLTTPLETALPKILPKILAGGFRVLVKCRDAAQMKLLDEKIWAIDAESFIPHGRANAPHAEQQPILLSTELAPLNASTLLMVVDGTLPSSEQLSSFAQLVDMFDGTQEAETAAARNRWKAYKEQGHTLSYFKQQGGGWKKEA